MVDQLIALDGVGRVHELPGEPAETQRHIEAQEIARIALLGRRATTHALVHVVVLVQSVALLLVWRVAFQTLFQPSVAFRKAPSSAPSSLRSSSMISPTSSPATSSSSLMT